MTPPNRKAFYVGLLSRYPETQSIRSVAEAEGVNAKALESAVRYHKLRPKHRRNIADNSMVRKLCDLGPDKTVAHGAVTPATIMKWRNGHIQPRLNTFALVAAANGLVLDLVPGGILKQLLGRVNDLRQRNMTGPEACAEMHDMIQDIIEGEM